MNNKKAFAHELLSYRKVYELPPLFEDFLNLCLIVLSPSALAGFPLDRERFEDILLKYSDPALPFSFVKAFTALMMEMRENHARAICCNDVLGDFYEEHILGYNPDNPFSSWDLDEHLCRGSDLITIPPAEGDIRRKNKLLDELCASGRRLLSRRWMHTVDGFYGMELQPVCAKMAILNLFLHQVPNAEVICKKADDLSYGFLFGYRFSEKILGIERIERKEDSIVWQIQEERMAIAA